ncbi:ABC transporter ATP-binding protein [Neorhizobium galegae]|uniref:Glutathione import ATP-binding protein GsiA n=1 Tax=Neorhizobium galegae bv. orientalis str. HAMBI 540 TaxID=1028800 RepID=A0A068T2E7_NEOGA|nr:ABC transporter ATP-binding protein [Neorhizobium galegae]CDN52201.1 Dipeptide ABC transporter, ATP-binding protein [Neorhizobium galegae bv. orientalis str. HAMBI 540]CDZ43385.1 ABC-type dipeptide/oligopeptide/nickel transport system, ATPase component [Neorhizobium galegae bv. orientalis]
MIDVENLTVRFGPRTPLVVKGISFTVERGKSFGLVGESGCGKSTVLRAISGLNRNYGGRISLDGKPLEPERSKAFFRDVQMVFQDPYGSLHPRKTVRSQLIEPLRNQNLPIKENAVSDVLKAVGLDPGLGYRFPHQLSGGQRQRVAIARALILDPPVLLLDEPTSALDVSVQAEILNLLADLQKERGLTYLLVSHDMAVIAHLCSRVAIMNGGEVVEETGIEQIRSGHVQHPYSQRLLSASRAYGKQEMRPVEVMNSA